METYKYGLNETMPLHRSSPDTLSLNPLPNPCIFQPLPTYKHPDVELALRMLPSRVNCKCCSAAPCSSSITVAANSLKSDTSTSLIVFALRRGEKYVWHATV